MNIPSKCLNAFLLRISLFPLCLPLFCLFIPAKASPCYPNDPNGENLGNLCFPNLFNPQQSGMNPSTFQQGFASSAYYGSAIGPGVPGTLLVPDHPSGTPMDKRLGNHGFWQSVEVNNNGTTLKTNTGREWKLQPVRFP